MIKITTAYEDGTVKEKTQEDHPQYDEYMSLLDIMKNTKCGMMLVSFSEGLEVLFTLKEKKA